MTSLPFPVEAKLVANIASYDLRLPDTNKSKIICTN